MWAGEGQKVSPLPRSLCKTHNQPVYPGIRGYPGPLAALKKFMPKGKTKSSEVPPESQGLPAASTAVEAAAAIPGTLILSALCVDSDTWG